jgi:membrane associated rhomboid family serine protease
MFSRRLTPVVRATLIVLVAAFVLTALMARTESGAAIVGALVLDPRLVWHRPWTLLTYGLVHSFSDVTHLLFNGLMLYFFGCELEELWGSRRFLVFQIVAVLMGGLFVVATALIGLGASLVLGASAIMAGCAIAWGLSFPDREMYFFFVVRLKGLHLVYVTIGLEILNAVSLSGTSAAAHFGGMAAGAFFASFYSGALRRMWLRMKLRRLQDEASSLHGRPARRAGGPPLRVIPGGGDRPPKDKRYLN